MKTSLLDIQAAAWRRKITHEQQSSHFTSPASDNLEQFTNQLHGSYLHPSDVQTNDEMYGDDDAAADAPFTQHPPPSFGEDPFASPIVDPFASNDSNYRMLTATRPWPDSDTDTDPFAAPTTQTSQPLEANFAFGANMDDSFGNQQQYNHNDNPFGAGADEGRHVQFSETDQWGNDPSQSTWQPDEPEVEMERRVRFAEETDENYG